MKLVSWLLTACALCAAPALAQDGEITQSASGKIVTQDGVPVQGFPVIVKTERDGTTQQIIAITGSDGVYNVEGLMVGDYSVQPITNPEAAASFAVPEPDPDAASVTDQQIQLPVMDIRSGSFQE